MTIEAKLKSLARRQAQIDAERDDAIRAAADAGLSRRQIAELVKLSHQRVQQIIKGQ